MSGDISLADKQVGSPHICVLGLGYIGLPLAALLASKGIRVSGVDVVQHVVDTVNRGELHLEEAGLDSILAGAVHEGFLTAHLKPVSADVYVMAVPTPILDDKSPDLKYVDSATASLASVLQPGNLVIIESTCPVGTTKRAKAQLEQLRPDLSFSEADRKEGQEQVYLAYCPERVIPGQVIKELVENARVIGGFDAPAAEKAAEFYGYFVKGELVKTNSPTAEMCKLSENAFRDVNIAFANELASLAEQAGVNPFDLIECANRHPRVKILQPGPGVGGHCIAVDPWFLVHAAPETAKLIRTARQVNDARPHQVIAQVEELIEGISNPVIACLGLAFKQDVDDLRESPSMEIVAHLGHANIGKILAVEPYIHEAPKEIKEAGVALTDLDAAVAQADVVVLLVGHKQFIEIDRSKLAGKAILDTRGIWR